MVTATQYLNYAVVTISWDDSIVTENNLPNSVPAGFCGTLTHLITDVTTNPSGDALLTSVFPNVDYASATKTLDFYSTDATAVQTYNL